MFEWPDASIYEGIQSRADANPERIALLWQGERTTYEELLREANRLARGLADLGVDAGDTIGVWLRNRPAWIETQLAASALGAAVVAINTRYRTHELEYVIDDADVSVFVTESSFLGTDYLDVLSSIVPAVTAEADDGLDAESFPALEHVIALEDASAYPGAVAYGDVKRAGDDTPDPTPVAAVDEPACLFYTSGTTSDPKGCPQTNRSLLEHSYRIGEHFALDAGDTALGTLPFCGVMGHNVFLSALAHGIPIVVQGHFDAERTLDLVEIHDVTYFSGLATMYERLIDAATFEPDRVGSLAKGAVVFINGFDRETFDRIEGAVDFPIVQPYGLSEGNSQVFVGDPTESRSVRRRVGGPLVFPEAEEAKIVDPETGDQLDAGDEGELLLRGFNVIEGYLGKPEETAAAFDDDGWFHTGDLAETDEEGNFYYISRLDDALRVRGFLVSPREIEQAIERNPAVEAAEVVGVTHDRHGQVPVAFVVGSESIQQSAVREFLDGRLADYKVPAAVYQLEDFPRTESPHGKKVQKNRLRDMAVDRFDG